MMLFAEAISSASTRSSLEMMLDAIRRKEEQQMDFPPALPTRPTSRGRLPSSRKSLLVSTALKGNGQEMNLCLPERRVEVKEQGDRKGETFECAEKSHAMRMFGLESYEERQEAEGPVDRKCSSSSLAINLAGQFKSGGAFDYFSNKKLGVWSCHPEEKWECEKIHSASANNAQVLMPGGKILMLPSEKILPANPVVHDNVNDPALLCFVNEPSILDCLEYRYSHDMIYRKEGPVLVAFNPFKDLSLQENKSVAASLQKVGENPHVFAIVDGTFHEILRAVANPANLFGCEVNALVLALSTQTSYSGNETIVQKLTLSQAIETRDALAKAICATLIDWVVVQINKSLNVGNNHGGSSISILDACGFNVSHKNGFDEFCSNNASEKMQQYYIRHLLKYEQEVLYDTSGFLKNNRELVHEDSLKDLFLSCKNQLRWLLASFGSTSSPMQCAATKLKVQLSEFIQQLENTNPHFIICVNPNSKQLAGIYEEDSVIRQLRSFSLLEIVRLARSGYPTKMKHQQFVERYQFLLMKNTAAMDPLSASVAVLQKYSVLPGMYQVGHTKILFRSGQLATLESARACTLQGILCIQKYFRGARARSIFNDVKNGVTTLQTFIRAERARNEFHYLARLHRAAVLIQMHVKRWVAQKAYSKQQKLILILQSVIRGWLARKHFNIGRNLEMTKCNDLNLDSDQSEKLHELEQDHSPLQDSDLSELKSRALKAEAGLRQKEEENSCLYQKLQQYETRWSVYDAKMKNLEEMWQKQMTSLQMSLAVAQRSLASNDVANLAGRPDVSPNYPYFDSEDAMSVETYTTEGTPVKQSRASGVRPNRTPEGARNAISHLVKEFEERRQIFEDDAGFLVEVKAGLSVSNLNPHDELSKLKVQFASWKKSYKVRLREVKTALQKIENSETGKKRRKWWGFWSSK